MGGRGSLGGTRSTYRGNSTALFRQGQQQGVDGANGGGGGNTSNGSGNGRSASTGGIQGGGGNGSGGGGSVTDLTPNDGAVTDIADMGDADLKDLFEQSDAFGSFLDRDVSESAYKREYDKAFTRWVQSADPGPSASPPADLTMNFSSTVSEDSQKKLNNQLGRVPLPVRKLMAERGLTMHVGARADDTPAWAGYVQATGLSSNSRIADGRTMGNLSFHSPSTNEVFISTSAPTSSRNVVAHEVSHHVDDNWVDGAVELEWTIDGQKQVYVVEYISRDDPEWTWVHNNYIKDNETFDKYYRGGPSGLSPVRGRQEFWAEGLASYFEGGIVGLRGFIARVPDADRSFVADTMVNIWKRYGII